MCFLLILCVVQLLAAGAKYYFATNVGKTQVFKAVMHAVLEADDFEHARYQVQAFGLGLAALTILGILCACFSMCFAKCFRGPKNVFLTRCMVCINTITYIIIMIFWFGVGAALVLPSQMGGKFIDDGCRVALANGTHESRGMQYFGDAFKIFVEFDDVYANSINRYMCTDFCICPGIPTD